MSKTRRYVAILAAAVTAAVMLPATTSSAHKSGTKTKAFLDDGGPSGANGHLTSMKDACLRNRRVSLFREQDGADQRYGTDMTNRSGKFDIDASLLAGMYYVKVKARDLDPSGDHDHMCLAAQSIKYRF